MKLYEIPKYLEKKVRIESWRDNVYIYFNGIAWVDDYYDGFYFMQKEDECGNEGYENDNWEEWKE